MSARSEEALPADFGKYRLLRKIATGGMAEIFLAETHDRPGEHLVIKRILPHLLKSAEFVSMFLDEARIASQLQHENIVRIHDIGQFQGSYYITMEYVHGEDIRRIYNCAYKLQRSLPLSHSIRVIAEAAKGLAYAHKLTDFAGRPVGLVHRDVSPQNILVTYEGGVKVVDFGIAKAATKVSQTRAGVLKGKYSYMSPEQAVGDPIDHRTDIFALGIILYETTTGTRLFKRHNELATLQAIIKCEVLAPTEALRGYPPELEHILLKALARDPRDRYSDAEELSSALVGFLRAAQLYVERSVIAAFMRDLFKDRLAEEEEEGKPALPNEDEVREEMAEATAVASDPSRDGAAIPVYRSSASRQPALEDTARPEGPLGFVEKKRRVALDVTTPEISTEDDSEVESRPAPSSSGSGGPLDAFAVTLRGDDSTASSSGELRRADRDAMADHARAVAAARLEETSDERHARLDPALFAATVLTPSDARQDLVPTMAAEPAYGAAPDSSRLPTAIPPPQKTRPHEGGLFARPPKRRAPPEDTDEVRSKRAQHRAPDPSREDVPAEQPLVDAEPPLWPRVGVLLAAIVAALIAGVVASQIATSIGDAPHAERNQAAAHGRLTILTEPGAKVWIDTDALGTATPDGLAGPFRVAAGPHEVRVVLDAVGFERSRAIEVQPDRVHEIEIRGRKGWLGLKVHPWAHVRVDGKDLGITPLADIELFEGTHHVVLENPDIGRRREAEVRIEGSRLFELKVNLNDVAEAP